MRTPGLDYTQIPIFIISRDKLLPLKGLVNWLSFLGSSNIYIIDNASTYPPLLRYFQETSAKVIRIEENLGPHKSIWGQGILDRYATTPYYIVSDSDLVPCPFCPPNIIEVMVNTLMAFPACKKVGPSLKIDDIPSCYALRDQVLTWESLNWRYTISGRRYNAGIDTTFAVYRSGDPFCIDPAIRLAHPYQFFHTPWYMDSKNRTEEEIYYAMNCLQSISNWDLEGLSSDMLSFASQNKTR